MQFRFIGATGGHVTGSCTHFYYPRKDSQFLVDCGLVQGEGDDFKQNSSAFPFDPSEIDFVLLTTTVRSKVEQNQLVRSGWWLVL